MKYAVKPCPICGHEHGTYERTLRDIDLVKCGACSFVFSSLTDEESLKANQRFDDDELENYVGWQTGIDQLWFSQIVSKLSRYVNQIRKPKVLDVGCGNGLLLKKFIEQGWEAYGVDPSPWSRRIAEQYGFQLYTEFLEKNRIPENFFDAVTSTSTLEHIPNPIPHIRAILRVLKAGGVAYFAGMPNYGSITVRLNVSLFHHNYPPLHANFFTYKVLKVLFSNARISPFVEKVIIHSYGIPEVHRLYNWASNLTKREKRSAHRLDSQSGNDTDKANTLVGLAVKAYYSLGRPLHLGDKLEAMVIRSPESSSIES